MKNSWILKQKKPVDNIKDLEEILLSNRDVKNHHDFFGSDTLKLEHPSNFYQIDEAVSQILKAIKEKRKIYIHGDYDADGIIATSIVFDYLYRELGADIIPIIPDREDEGYGVSEESLERIKDQGAGLVITVDCGVKDSRIIDKWSKLGFEFIVTDHHEFEYDESGKPVLPSSSIIIHTNHPKSTFNFTQISGAATAWKLIWAIDESVKNEGMNNIEKYLDLVAITTVTDIMPLVEENRLIVKTGLEKIRNTENIGLKELIIESKLKPEDIDAYHFGFVIGPKINASGRIGNPVDAVRLFTTKDTFKSKEYAVKLNLLNQERQGITHELYEILAKDISKEDRIIIVREDMNEGVIGLIAGKVTDRFHRPSIVFTSTADGYLKGSARSIKDIHIVKELDKLKDMIHKYGGHAGAAGLTIKEELFENFKDGIRTNFDAYEEEIFDKKINIDCELLPKIVDIKLVEEIDKFKPFGYKNSSPNFLLRNMIISDKSYVGRDGNHLKMVLELEGSNLYSIGFNMSDKTQDFNIGDRIDIVFTPQINEWNGRKNLDLRLIEIDYSN